LFQAASRHETLPDPLLNKELDNLRRERIGSAFEEKAARFGNE